jgi:hypothetical protein
VCRDGPENNTDGAGAAARNDQCYCVLYEVPDSRTLHSHPFETFETLSFINFFMGEKHRF